MSVLLRHFVTKFKKYLRKIVNLLFVIVVEGPGRKYTYTILIKSITFNLYILDLFMKQSENSLLLSASTFGHMSSYLAMYLSRFLSRFLWQTNFTHEIANLQTTWSDNIVHGVIDDGRLTWTPHAPSHYMKDLQNNYIRSVTWRTWIQNVTIHDLQVQRFLFCVVMV